MVQSGVVLWPKAGLQYAALFLIPSKADATRDGRHFCEWVQFLHVISTISYSLTTFVMHTAQEQHHKSLKAAVEPAN